MQVIKAVNSAFRYIKANWGAAEVERCVDSYNTRTAFRLGSTVRSTSTNSSRHSSISTARRLASVSSVPFTGQSTGKEPGNFRRGKKDGPWLTYHENGQLSTEVTYKNGKEAGAWVSSHENGQLRGKGTYKNGKPVGPWVRHHENGQLAFKGIYKNGQRDGPWVSYKMNGTVNQKETGTFKDGIKVE